LDLLEDNLFLAHPGK